MKFFSVLGAVIFSFALAGCVTAERQQACMNIAHGIGKDHAWVKECGLNEGIYNTGLYELAMISPPEELCAAEQDAISPNQKNMMSSIAKKRDINCSPYRKQRANTFVQTASATDLCLLWNTSGLDSETTEVVRKYVAKQGIDCPAMFAAAAQQQQAYALQQQAYAQQQQAYAQQQQVYNQKQQTQALINAQRNLANQSSSTVTNCRSDYSGGVRCETKPSYQIYDLSRNVPLVGLSP